MDRNAYGNNNNILKSQNTQELQTQTLQTPLFP